LKINSKNNNKIFNICILFSKIEKSDLKNLKHSKILYPIIFQYENFNESEKLKFGDDLKMGGRNSVELLRLGKINCHFSTRGDTLT
jgi:hypothetical protein